MSETKSARDASDEELLNRAEDYRASLHGCLIIPKNWVHQELPSGRFIVTEVLEKVPPPSSELVANMIGLLTNALRERIAPERKQGEGNGNI